MVVVVVVVVVMMTCTKLFLLVFDPSPSCPYWFQPVAHTLPSFFSTMLCVWPAEIAWTPACTLMVMVDGAQRIVGVVLTYMCVCV